MATQNPIEMEGTYPLPEAQLDRFLMKILVTYPSHAELARIVERTIAKEENTVHAVLDRDDVLQLRATCREVLVAPHVQDYAVQHGHGHPARSAGSPRLRPPLHPLRQFAARRPGARRVRTRPCAAARPLPPERRGYPRTRARRAAPPHHSEFRRPRGRQDRPTPFSPPSFPA